MTISNTILYCYFRLEYSNLLSYELIKYTPRTILIHISSSTQIMEFLTVDRIVFPAQTIELHKYYFCGRIIVQDKIMGITKVGYIIDKT